MCLTKWGFLFSYNAKKSQSQLRLKPELSYYCLVWLMKSFLNDSLSYWFHWKVSHSKITRLVFVVILLLICLTRIWQNLPNKLGLSFSKLRASLGLLCFDCYTYCLESGIWLMNLVLFL